jgi:deoxyribodipyrimidine photolyase
VRDDKIKKELSALGISIQSFNGDLLYEPWEIYDDSGLAFTTFNMYWEKCMELPIDASPSLAPWKLVPVPGRSWLVAYHYLSFLFLKIFYVFNLSVLTELSLD